MEITNLAPNVCVTLRDNIIGIAHDLRTGPYVCQIADTTLTARFELTVCSPNIVTSTKTIEQNQNSVLISQDGTGAFVKTSFDNTKSTIIAYNVMGQKIMDDKEIEGTNNLVYLDFKDTHNQIVIIKVTTDKSQTTKKVFLN